MRSIPWRYHARGGRRTIVLLPGWATDARIFAELGGDYNLIAPRGMLTSAPDGLADFLAGLDAAPVVLLGWSLGGYAAADFACRYPDLTARVILVGIRPRYPVEQIDTMRQAIARDRASCLTSFYRQCFFPGQRSEYRLFQTTLEPAYVAAWGADELLAGLDYLAEASLTPASMPPRPTELVHGAGDVIAPLSEARRLGEAAGVPVHVVADAAHAVFLSAPFPRYLDDACSHDQK